MSTKHAAGVVLLALLCAGCFVARPAGEPLKHSPFHEAVSKDVRALVERALPEKDVVLEVRSTGESSGSSTTSLHSQRHETLDLRCTPEELDKLLRALREEFRRLMTAHGARVDEVAEGGGEGKRLVSFEIGYSSGNAHGEVEVTAAEGPETGVPARPQKPDAKNYRLQIRVEEWVR